MGEARSNLISTPPSERSGPVALFQSRGPATTCISFEARRDYEQLTGPVCSVYVPGYGRAERLIVSDGMLRPVMEINRARGDGIDDEIDDGEQEFPSQMQMPMTRGIHRIEMRPNEYRGDLRIQAERDED